MPCTFSVVIPTYNHAEFIKDAVDSVLEQTFQDFEVIVVNNFSTDHTLEVLGQIEDPRFQVINFQNNGVIGTGRNVGIKASEGEYIAFLDSDDTWFPNKLEKVAEAIKEDPEVGLICHDQDLLRNDVIAKRTHYGPPPGFRGSMFEMILFVGNGPSTSATVVSRSALEEVGCFSEDTDLITTEDYDLWLKLSKVCRFKFLNENLGTHYYHMGGVSANFEIHLRNTLNVLDRHCPSLLESPTPYPKGPIRRRYAKAFYGAARQAQRNGLESTHQGRRALIKAAINYARCLRKHPFYLRAYAGLVLLLGDLVLGQARRRKLAQAVWGPASHWG